MPDHITENQIDHVCISKKIRRTMQGVRVKTGTDVEVLGPKKQQLKEGISVDSL